MRRFVLILAACGGPDPVVDPEPDPRQVEAFPRCAEHDPLRRPFFGDTHVHTALSLDANLQGTRLSPGDAYRFAQGDTLGIHPYDDQGNALRSARLDRPLDFVALSDHAEFLGAVALCQSPGSPAYDHPSCVAYRNNPDAAFLSINATTAAEPEIAAYPPLCGDDGQACLEAGFDVWAEVIDAAEVAYDRTDACTFTSFVAYEWSGGPGTRNLHRNVIFRSDAVPELPLSYFDAPEAPTLWDGLTADCLDAPPCDVLTIPHNSNLSSGLMFEPLAGGAGADLVALRARMEPLVEVFQHKGDSECWPGSPAADELCGFEKLPYNTLAGSNLDINGDPVPLDFIRDALAEGLRVQARTGVNPYQYGFVASTDTHLGTPGLAAEADFPGHGGAGQSNRDALPTGLPDNVTFNPGGLAVLWAEENTREALFRAMLRREAYGTSGPRIVLRMFAGRGFRGDVCDQPVIAEEGYAKGVPMGGLLAAGSGPPSILVAAQSDPGGPGVQAAPSTPLERIQVVKGWLDGDTPRFTVIDVQGGAGDAGSSHRCALWTDPDFDPAVPAFWYARAIEVPTDRWHTRQCDAAGITCPSDDPDWASCCDPRVEAKVQERAWSSPVWWTPDAG